MITNNIPCNDCITLSMCLNKEARDVLDCPFVKEYIQKEPDTKNTASQHVNECISRWNSICSVLNIPKYKRDTYTVIVTWYIRHMQMVSLNQISLT